MRDFVSFYFFDLIYKALILTSEGKLYDQKLVAKLLDTKYYGALL